MVFVEPVCGDLERHSCHNITLVYVHAFVYAAPHRWLSGERVGLMTWWL